MNPGKDPLGDGYQITQSKIALGSGGFEGKGFMQGSQSQLDFLPYKHTDFIFTTIAEEFGFFGGVGLLLIYSIMIIFCIYSSLFYFFLPVAFFDFSGFGYFDYSSESFWAALAFADIFDCLLFNCIGTLKSELS